MAREEIVAKQGVNEYFKEPSKNTMQLFNFTTGAYYLLVDASSSFYNISELPNTALKLLD